MDRTDGSGVCSITVHLKQTQQVTGGGVLFEACRVGCVNESDGTMTLNWDLGELTKLRPSMPTEEATRQLSLMLFGNRTEQTQMPSAESVCDVEIRTAVTSEDGVCSFQGLEEGAWLIHAADSTSYGRIEDTLAAVPCYIQQGTAWIGPVYDSDIWPKGEIGIKQFEEEPQTEKSLTKPAPTTEKKHTETERTLETTKMTETEKPGDKQENPKEPESEKKTRTSFPGTTSQSTQVVRTLDDTPVSGLICAFLSSVLLISLIISRRRRLGKRCRGRHLAFVLGAGVLFSVAPGVKTFALEEGDFVGMLEEERKIVFVNESPDAPCLSVAKEVLDALNGSRAPAGDRFVFRLFLDHERAGGIRYRIFNEAGEELVDLTGGGVSTLVIAGSAQGDPVPLRTGRDGSFTLAAGQYALFEEVSVGQLWEVTELQREHYERISPKASDTVSGTIERNGNQAQFVNRYLPEEDPGYTEGVLEITKEILWPEDCALPDRGQFQIRIQVDGRAWSNALVELYDREDGSAAEETRTDANGVFAIRGGQRAVIRSLPLGSDAVVEEIDDPEDAFVPSGDTTWKGAVTSHGRVAFTNRLADFVVVKTLLSGDPDHPFRFCLLQKDERPWAGIPYYLIDEEGELETDGPRYTDGAGHFSLHSGQRAVFAGMEEGTRYSVLEEKILGYRQVTPQGEDGYRNLSVKNGIPSLLFENEQADVKLFVPSAGGTGIRLLLIAAIAGMGICLAALRERKETGMRKIRKSAAVLLAVLLCLTNLTSGMSAETEQEACGIQQENELEMPDTEEEVMQNPGMPGPESPVLAGPVEMNSGYRGLIVDMDAPDEDENGEDNLYGGDDLHEGDDQETEADDAASDSEETRPEYRYEESMSLKELALLPKEEAGAATEVSKERAFSAKSRGVVKSSAQSDSGLWACSDYYVGEKDLYHVSREDDFSLKYQIEFHTSTDLEEGSVEIRVPEALLTKRDGSSIVPSQIGVPNGTVQAPVQSLNSPFNWYRDDLDGTLVFFNYRAIDAGTNTAFQVLYHPVRILDLVDGSAWSVTPQIRVVLQNETVQTEEMEALTGEIDSRALLLGASADVFSDGSISCLPALYTKNQVQRVLGGGLPQFVSEEGEWLFIAWQIDWQGEYNQPWSMRMDAALSASSVAGSDDSCVVGSITKVTGTSEGSGGQGNIIQRTIAQEGSTTLAEVSSAQLSPYVKQGLFHLTTIAVTAVRKRSLRENGSVLGLRASLALTPLDGIDGISTSEAAASWTFIDYRWKYKGDVVGIFAWSGDRNADGSVSYNARDVSLSGWIDEYRLSRISQEPAGSIPMRIQTECRGYSYTHETGGPAAGSYIEGTGYEVTTVDDAVYLACQNQGADTGMQLLTQQDYYYSDVTVTIRDRGMDIFEDRVCAPMSAEECPGADRSTKIWVLYENSSDWELAAECPWNSSGKISYTFSRNQLQRKIWRIKVVHHAVDYDSSCIIDAGLCIRPESPVCGGLLTAAGENDSVHLKAEHLGSVLARSTGGSSSEWFHDQDPSHYDGAEPGIADLTLSLYGMYSMRKNSFAELTPMKKHAKALKSVFRENDPENGCIRLTCSIGALEGYQIYSQEAAQRIRTGESNLPAPDRCEYVIYDLLPEGVLFDPSVPVRAGLVTGVTDKDLVTSSLWNSRDVSVRIDPGNGIVNNWKNTGREMVILNVSVALDEQQIPRMSGGMWMNGVGVQFGAVCPYRDLKRMRAMPNIAAIMPGYGCDDPAGQILGSDEEVSCDDGIVVPYTGTEQEELSVFGADIDSDGVTNLRTVLYAIARSEADTAVSLTDGIHLTVKADRDTFSDWDVSAHTGPGDPYTYRIDVTNTSSQPISELVIADHLERAQEERELAESGRVFDAETWRGSLESVDTRALERCQIAPVVWLSADPQAPLPGEGNPPDSVLCTQNGWIRLEDWTSDMGEVRSVAVDLRRRADGSSFQLEMGDNVHFLLHMRSPMIGDGEGETRAEHTYNCASFYSISQDEPDGDLVQGDAVEVTLEERSALIVEKELTGDLASSSSGTSFLFRLMRSAQAVPLAEYRLEEKRDDGAGGAVWRDDGNLHTTGRDGTFSISAGQRAVFENETGGDALSAVEICSACYEVFVEEENTPEGRVCRFDNTWYPTLYLTKKVFGSPDDADLSADVFRVRVTADGGSMAGMPYYTVDPTGGLVENQVLEEHTVDADSCVYLHPGEVIALHPGDAECVYEVEEDGSCLGEGTDYAGVTVEKRGVLGPEGSSIILENAWRWKELILHKEILHQGEHVCSETFSFRLWRMHEGVDASAFDPDHPESMADPVPGVECRMEQEDFLTDENGSFHAECAGKDVVLKHLEAQASYVIQEIDPPADYEMLNGGLVSAVMPLLGSRKYVTIQNSWNRRSLEVSKAVLSGVHQNRTTVFTPGYPGSVISSMNYVELFSFSDSSMTGFTVEFPEELRLVGNERIRIRSGSRDIDNIRGTIEAGTTRTYTGYSQVAIYLWGLSGQNKKGFFFYFKPDLGTGTGDGMDQTGRTFSFLLEMEDEDGALRASPDTPYRTSAGDELQTDENGCFTLASGMTATFVDISEEGKAWRVTESPDASCPQVYPSSGQPQSGVFGQHGEDVSHALFINGENCQGMFRKQFTAHSGDETAGRYLEAERAKGSSSSLKSVFLIEVDDGSGTYTAQTQPLLAADALTGELLRLEPYHGRICLSENQTVLLSGTGSGGSWRITEIAADSVIGEDTVYCIVCTDPGEGAERIIRASDQLCDTVFVNEIHSFPVSTEVLIQKKYLPGSAGWDIIPDGAVLAFCLERYENGNWYPAQGVEWIQCLNGKLHGTQINQTGADGIIRVRREAASGAETAAGYPVVPIAISGENVRTQLYYMEQEAQEGDLRIRELPDLSDPSFGMLAGCEDNTFINENNLQAVCIEKQTDIETNRSFSMKIEQLFGEIRLPGKHLSYQIRDASTGEVTGSGKTDSRGEFSLRSGTQAVFELAAGTKWEVTEKSSSWNLASCTMDQNITAPEPISGGMLFEMANIRRNMSLTSQMLTQQLRDPLSGQLLDFTSQDLTIPHYVKRGDEILEITKIDNDLFSQSLIRSVVIAEGIKSIGKNAFYDSERLISVRLPQTLEEMGDTCFCFTAISELEIPSSVKTVGRTIAYGSPNLTHVIVHQNASDSPFAGYEWGTYSDPTVDFVE